MAIFLRSVSLASNVLIVSLQFTEELKVIYLKLPFHMREQIPIPETFFKTKELLIINSV